MELESSKDIFFVDGTVIMMMEFSKISREKRLVKMLFKKEKLKIMFYKFF